MSHQDSNQKRDCYEFKSTWTDKVTNTVKVETNEEGGKHYTFEAKIEWSEVMTMKLPSSMRFKPPKYVPESSLNVPTLLSQLHNEHPKLKFGVYLMKLPVAKPE